MTETLGRAEQHAAGTTVGPFVSPKGYSLGTDTHSRRDRATTARRPFIARPCDSIHEQTTNGSSNRSDKLRGAPYLSWQEKQPSSDQPGDATNGQTTV